MATKTQTKVIQAPVKAPVAVANVPLAPAHPAGPAPKSVKGPHIQAWRSCANFALDASLEIVQGTANPWRANTPGDRFYREVLSAKGVKTVGDAVKVAEGKFREADVQGHLRWIYTMADGRVRINGKLWSQDPHVKSAKAKVSA